MCNEADVVQTQGPGHGGRRRFGGWRRLGGRIGGRHGGVVDFDRRNRVHNRDAFGGQGDKGCLSP